MIFMSPSRNIVTRVRDFFATFPKLYSHPLYDYIFNVTIYFPVVTAISSLNFRFLFQLLLAW